MRATASGLAQVYATIRTSFFGASVTAYSCVPCTIYLARARCRSHDCAYCCAVAGLPLAAARAVAIAARYAASLARTPFALALSLSLSLRLVA